MANIYKVTFEIIKGVFFFHPFCIVEARDIDHAKERAMQVMNSHPDNVEINKEIVDVQEVDKDEHPNYITIDEVMPYQPVNEIKENDE
ncbi:hypothetical protein BFS35_012190 [Macrococcoides goetzii]|uniref:Uncharacterized protein n=1 Tax=Macrococcoides goetzii TaxID=1891097 RepID=A0A2G5NWM4_9STAP|nr:hypothetical protein [Macrococcus goetzii]RAI79313.1 hypothetical protein BFS35_012190 [Macrococcus goetzii]